MTLLLSLILTLAAVVLAIPISFLFFECFLAVLDSKKSVYERLEPRPKIAVLVPAHDEAIGIAATLKTLVSQLTSQDELIVIADNCTDETAIIARDSGAKVIERYDPDHRGKGYALDFGLKYLTANPPEAVIVVDADSIVAPGTIEKIAGLAVSHSRPVQATYLLTRNAPLAAKDSISFLAFTVKNLVRPIGLAYFGLPCLLTGTGMAFPWSIMDNVSLASGNIVEDMKLSIDFALADYPPLFCSYARITGRLPQQSHAAKSQRTRWEHGHLQTLLTQVPRLLKETIKRRRGDFLAIALDLCIPPLSLLVMLWMFAAISSLSLVILGGSQFPLILLSVEGALIFAAILASWAKFAKNDLPLITLLSVPLYILWKVPLYFAFLVKPQTNWVRTERDVLDSSKL